MAAHSSILDAARACRNPSTEHQHAQQDDHDDPAVRLPLQYKVLDSLGHGRETAPSNLIGANGFAVGGRSLGWRLRHPEGTRPLGAP